MNAGSSSCWRRRQTSEVRPLGPAPRRIAASAAIHRPCQAIARTPPGEGAGGSEAEKWNCVPEIPGFPRNPSLAPLSLFVTVQYIPPVAWLFALYCAGLRAKQDQGNRPNRLKFPAHLIRFVFPRSKQFPVYGGGPRARPCVGRFSC